MFAEELPSLFVYEVCDTPAAYEYVSDEDFYEQFSSGGGVQVGYFNLYYYQVKDVKTSGELETYKTANDAAVAGLSNGKLGKSAVATEGELRAGTATEKFISPSVNAEAVFFGLAKAAGVNETTLPYEDEYPEYSDDTKAAIKDLLGVANVLPDESAQADGTRILVKSGDIFRITPFSPESTDNRVTAVGAGSTNTEYPTAKATYNAIQSLQSDMIEDFIEMDGKKQDKPALWKHKTMDGHAMTTTTDIMEHLSAWEELWITVGFPGTSASNFLSGQLNPTIAVNEFDGTSSPSIIVAGLFNSSTCVYLSVHIRKEKTEDNRTIVFLETGYQQQWYNPLNGLQKVGVSGVGNPVYKVQISALNAVEGTTVDIYYR